MPSPKTPIEAAFEQLADALATDALGNPAAFERIAAFRRKVLDLAERYAEDRPASGPRAKKGEG